MVHPNAYARRCCPAPGTSELALWLFACRRFAMQCEHLCTVAQLVRQGKTATIEILSYSMREAEA